MCSILVGVFLAPHLLCAQGSSPDIAIIPNGRNLGHVGHADRILGLARITNVGPTPRTIRSVRSNCGCYKVSCAAGTLLPGESAIVNFDLTFPRGKELHDPVIYILTDDKERPMRYIPMKMSLSDEPGFSTAKHGEVILQLDGSRDLENGKLEFLSRETGVTHVEERPHPGTGKRYPLKLTPEVDVEQAAKGYAKSARVCLPMKTSQGPPEVSGMTHIREVRGTGGATRQPAANMRAGRHLCKAALMDTDLPGYQPGPPEVSGVEPDTTYKYVFGWEEGGSDEDTAVQTTRTWPEQQDITDFSFIVYGDNRGDNNHDFRVPHRDVACLGILRGGCIFQGGVQVDEEIVYLSDYPAFVLHSGDLVCEGGDALEWIPHFFRPAGNLLGRVPVFPCVGNHETNGDSSASNFVALFDLPENATNPDDKERYYSFNYGNCHFVVLDTFYDWSPGIPDEDRDDFFDENSDQHAWLRSDLAQSGPTWKFVIMHVPAYTGGGSHPYGAPDVTAVRNQLALPVFNKSQYGVTMVLSGHNHFYERSYVDYSDGPGGVHYIVTGGGGAPLHTPNPADNPKWVYSESVKHYCLIKLTEGGDRLVFRAYRVNGSGVEDEPLILEN